MKKLSEKIHHQFVSGRINGAIFNYMQKIAANVNDADALLFDTHINKLTNWGARTICDCEKYFQIYTKTPRAFEQITHTSLSFHESDVLCKYAFDNRDKYDFSKKHNIAKLILDFINNNKDLIKNSHPNNMGIESSEPIRAPYNIDKWIETMRYIYDTANTNNLPLDSISKQVTAQWEEDERIHFQRWMKYYQEGNYGKYNVKTAQFFQNRQEQGKVPDLKSVQDLLEPSAPKTDPNVDKKKRLDEARHKLRGRLKSVEELVEKYRDVLPKDISTIIRKDVYELKEKVLGLELKASIIDSINRTSNQLKKHGFMEGAQILRKIAQEVAEDTLPTTAPVAPVPTEIPSPNPDIETPVIGTPAPEVKKDAPIQETLETTDKDHIRVPEVNIGEDTIEIPDFGSATHRDALQKLEEINKVISERNVVRALAAVDIILGQLGIASYFPQLSEAQSKLMDAFNYAGTRVAETIGQMRGGSGGPVSITPPSKPKEPQPETVEVSEEVEKPIEEVVSGGPPTTPAPKTTPIQTKKPKVE